MSPLSSSRQVGRQAVRQLPFFLWLVVVWMALWGQLSALALVTGVLVAFFVVRAFYLPPAEAPGRFNLYRFVILVGTFVVDLARASFLVAWQATRRRPIGASSVIQVDLRTTSDLIMTLTAEAVTLVPGSFVLEVDRSSTTLYLHILGASSMDDVELMRSRVFAQEERLIRALGGPDDVARLKQWHARPENHAPGWTPVRARKGTR